MKAAKYEKKGSAIWRCGARARSRQRSRLFSVLVGSQSAPGLFGKKHSWYLALDDIRDPMYRTGGQILLSTLIGMGY
eukprot:6176988-Pleurochrysis_carterae.AAC.2